MSQLNRFLLKKLYFKDIIRLKCELITCTRYVLKRRKTSVADETIKQYEIENSVDEHRACFSEPAAVREIQYLSPSEETYTRNSLKWKERHTPPQN